MRISICSIAMAIAWSSPSYCQSWQRYLKDTLTSLDCMKQATGLWSDKVLLTSGPGICPVIPLFGPTSPTNIALDLLIQLELFNRDGGSGEELRRAHRNIRDVLTSLEAMTYHFDSGLFYNRYSPYEDLSVAEDLVSTVDNIHLAFALWAVSKQLGLLESGVRSQKLFDRMNFSKFYDPTDGLFYGAMRKRDGVWYVESWKYRYFGSESRSLYSLGYALGLIKDPDFLDKAFTNLQAEVFRENGKSLLGLWDGGTFQLFLPRLLVNEGLYSPRFREFFKSYGEQILMEQDEKELELPAAFSACQYGVDAPQGCGDYPCYNGKVGLPALVSSYHQEFNDPAYRKNWDRVVSPHGVFLASFLNPIIFEKRLEKAEVLTKNSTPLYVKGIGWLDGYHVRDSEKGDIVPVLLSLNQGMAALSIFQLLSIDQMTTGARLLHLDMTSRAKLIAYYKRADLLLDQAPDRQTILNFLAPTF